MIDAANEFGFAFFIGYVVMALLAFFWECRAEKFERAAHYKDEECNNLRQELDELRNKSYEQ